MARARRSRARRRQWEASQREGGPEPAADPTGGWSAQPSELLADLRARAGGGSPGPDPIQDASAADGRRYGAGARPAPGWAGMRGAPEGGAPGPRALPGAWAPGPAGGAGRSEPASDAAAASSSAPAADWGGPDATAAGDEGWEEPEHAAWARRGGGRRVMAAAVLDAGRDGDGDAPGSTTEGRPPEPDRAARPRAGGGARGGGRRVMALAVRAAGYDDEDDGEDVYGAYEDAEDEEDAGEPAPAGPAPRAGAPDARTAAAWRDALGGRPGPGPGPPGPGPGLVLQDPRTSLAGRTAARRQPLQRRARAPGAQAYDSARLVEAVTPTIITDPAQARALVNGRAGSAPTRSPAAAQTPAAERRSVNGAGPAAAPAGRHGAAPGGAANGAGYPAAHPAAALGRRAGGPIATAGGAGRGPRARASAGVDIITGRPLSQARAQRGRTRLRRAYARSRTPQAVLDCACAQDSLPCSFYGRLVAIRSGQQHSMQSDDKRSRTRLWPGRTSLPGTTRTRRRPRTGCRPPPRSRKAT